MLKGRVKHVLQDIKISVIHIDKIFCNFFYILSHQYDPYEHE